MRQSQAKPILDRYQGLIRTSPAGYPEYLAQAPSSVLRKKVMQITRLWIPVLLMAVQWIPATAYADVSLRIESRPITRRIEAYVRVWAGEEVAAGLEPGDFALTLDGKQVDRFGFRLPPDQDPAQRPSIVLVLADGRAIESAIPAVSQLPQGSFVAIIRAKYEAGDPTPWLALHPFTRIDGASGSQSLTGFLQLSLYDLAMLRYGSRTPHLDFLSAGLDQRETPGVALPPGPKAIVLVGNGRYIESWSGLTQSGVVARANRLGVPVFTIGTEDFSDRPEINAVMAAVARDTGGRYLRGDTAQLLRKAYLRIWDQLGSAYRLAIASTRVTDCNPHMLEVTVLGETASATFVRCDTTPDPLVFRTREAVQPDSLVVSNAATIGGIESPVVIKAYGGWYSLGCNSGFTKLPRIARAGDRVCVRHRASSAAGEVTETTLIVGGVASSFYSTTRVPAP